MVICVRHCALKQRQQKQQTMTTDDHYLLLGTKLGEVSALEEVGKKQRRLDELIETS